MNFMLLASVSDICMSTSHTVGCPWLAKDFNLTLCSGVSCLAARLSAAELSASKLV